MRDTQPTTTATAAEARHTPGPWRVEAQRGRPVILAGADDVTEIAVVTSEEFTDTGADYIPPPNACLLAAAPLLLEALQDFREHVIRYAVQWSGGGGSHHHPIWARVADAIAAATGEER